MRCTHPDCRDSASARCEAGDGPRCGAHCACPGHYRRRDRGGNTRSRGVQGVLRRSTLSPCVQVLSEAVEVLTTPPWLQDVVNAGFRSLTAVRRELLRGLAVCLREGRGTPTDDDGLLMHLLPVSYFERLLDALRRKLSTEQVIALAETATEPAAQGSASSSAGPVLLATASAPAKRTHEEAGFALDVADTAVDDVAELPETFNDAVPRTASRWAREPPPVLPDEVRSVQDLAQSDVWRDFAAGPVLWPPAIQSLPHLDFVSQVGRLPWNVGTNAPARPGARWMGSQPVMQLGGKKAAVAFENWVQNGSALGVAYVSAADAAEEFTQWCVRRAPLAERIESVSWCESPTGVCYGRWLRLELRGVTFSPDCSCSGVFRRGFHGTSLHVLQRVVAGGLEAGRRQIMDHGQALNGIYYMRRERAYLCHFYMSYVALSRNGFLYGVLLQLRSRASDGRRMTVQRPRGNQQWVTYEDIAILEVVYIHVVHMQDVARLSNDQVLLAEGSLFAEFELDPCESQAVIEERSYTLRTEVV